jgi:protoporphyrinogen oxidase
MLENGLYYGELLVGRKFVIIPKQYDAKYPQTYITKIVEPSEQFVEFSSLDKMSALNFMWQSKWSLNSGRIIVPRAIQKVPDYYRNQLKSTNIVLNAQVTSILQQKDNTFIVTTRQGTKYVNATFDFVINSADTNAVLKMMNFKDDPLSKMCKANTYTATIALHIEVDTPASRLIPQGTAPGLCTQSGLLQQLGGVMFHTYAQGVSLGGRDIISMFSRTASTQDILRKVGNQSDDKVGAYALNILLGDLRNVARRDNSGSLSDLVDAVSRGKIVSSKVWAQALPEFGTGYISAVANYKQNSFGKLNRHFYMGQAIYGRSIAMVIPGVERDWPTIKAAISNF